MAHSNTNWLQSSHNTSFLLERKRMSQQVLQLSETENSRCSLLRLNKPLIGSRNNQIPDCVIYGLVRNDVRDNSNRREKYNLRQIQWIWIGRRHCCCNLLTGPNVHSNLLRLFGTGRGVGGWVPCPISYPLHCHRQKDSARMWAAVSDIFMVH